jgi:PAS domain S-box-containing protein
MNEPSDETRVFRAVFERAIDGMVLSNDHAIVEANAAACELFGVPKDALLGRKVSDFATMEFDAPAAQREFAETGTASGRMPIARSDGTERTVLFMAVANIVDGHHLVVLHDATALALAEQRQALLASIVEYSGDAILSKDLDGTITSWNEAATQLYGYSEAEAIGRNVRMLFPAELVGEADVLMQKLLAGERVRKFETVRMTKAGERVDVALTISPVKDRRGRIVGASTVAHDLTPRRRAEAKLRSRSSCGKRRRWRRSGTSPAASRTTSTTCSRSCSATPSC